MPPISKRTAERAVATYLDKKELEMAMKKTPSVAVSPGVHNNTKSRKTDKIAVTVTKPAILTLVVEVRDFNIEAMRDLMEQADSLGHVIKAEIVNPPSTISLA